MTLTTRLAVPLLSLAGAVMPPRRVALRRLSAVLTLFDSDRICANFSAMDRVFPVLPLPAGPHPLPLPQGPLLPEPAGLAGFLDRRTVTALVVLKDGAIVTERYLQGTGAQDRRISWSVAKSFLSALFGIVVRDGAIRSIEDPVCRYAPALRGSAYDGVPIRAVLAMSSGVRFDEDYLSFRSDINRMGRVLALGRSMDGFACTLTARNRPAGEAWTYVSIDTHVLGMVLRGATGEPVAGLMADRLLVPLGLEADPYYLTDGLGEPFVLGGLNMRSRDYARFGLLFAQGGAANGRQIVPADWVAASTRPQARTAPGEFGYGFQWWLPPGAEAGEFLARGIYGQYIYINRRRGTVIAINAADRAFSQPGVPEDYVAFFRGIAQS
ncbi:MAG: serine hydrolase domain-containing protein [Pseudorhodobacter sp.]